MEVEQSEPLCKESEYVSRFKRPADTSTEEFENEIKETSEDAVESLLLTGMCWADSGLPVLAEIGLVLELQLLSPLRQGPRCLKRQWQRSNSMGGKAIVASHWGWVVRLSCCVNQMRS